ncbi:sulfite exporter TauE/SafE family protein [Halomicrococcus sp. NG-SE-24]|uniref:sulfite exporter TauE/SafE family protein n=1 Tax=Halomicrococcus sp. NG-SE-24 TaxID=3436928 RepID=UPI003D9823DB
MSLWSFNPGVLFFVVFGFAVGILFGFFGLGGSFFVTPALLVLGHPVEAAVGSGLVFVFGTSVTAVVTHRRLGHIDYKLGVILIVGMATGLGVGKRLLFELSDIGLANFVISVAYVGLLAAVGLFVLRDARTVTPEDDDVVDATPLRRMGAIRIPPMLSFSGGVTASMWVVIGIAFATGILAGLLGVGGGFLVLPSLMYGLTLPETIAVGTDIFQIAVSSGYGAFLYARADAVHLSVVLPLLGGSVLGASLGSRLTEYIVAAKFKEYFALILLVDSLAVASKVVSHTYGVFSLHVLSIVLLFGTALVMSVVIISFGIRNLTYQSDRQ